MSLESLPFYAINAFTAGSPHSGNQAGVVVFPANDPRAKDDEYIQKVARDVNYAETAFVEPSSDGQWHLRWFTPEVEVPLCGHATLAAAQVIFSRDPKLTSVRFQTRFSGELRAEKVSEVKNGSKVQIFLPTFKGEDLAALKQSTEQATRDVKAEAGVYGVEQAQVVNAAYYNYLGRSTIVQLAPEVDLAALKYAPREMAKSSKLTIVTQLKPDLSSPGRVVIHSRVHAYDLGVEEDPVTGAAHAFLVAYYLKTSARDTIPSELVPDEENLVFDATQVSERGGALECRLVGKDVAGLTGTACEMSKGTLSVW